MPVFQNDNSGYISWLDGNPTGWVLNVPVGSGTVVQHRSSCGTIRGERDWTGGTYFKVAEPFTEALDHWLAANRSGTARACGLCQQIAIRAHTEAVPRPQVIKQAQTSAASMCWQLWTMGPPVKVLNQVEPRLASWDHREHPNMLRLKDYLAPVRAALAPILATGRDWSINLVVDVGRQKNMHRGHDVENYLTPLVKDLNGSNFVHATVSKRVGGGSLICIGRALRRSDVPAWTSWSGRVGEDIAKEQGKHSIRDALRAETQLPPGPVAVHMAWRLPAARNWVSLWKPTGDAMGPILGEPNYRPGKFNPDDDRIVDLELHRMVDDALAGVDVGIWWAQR